MDGGLVRFFAVAGPAQFNRHDYLVALPVENSAGYEWNAMDAINHIRNTSVWTSNVFPYTQFETDATNGNLPAVTWLVPYTAVSEHPPEI